MYGIIPHNRDDHDNLILMLYIASYICIIIDYYDFFMACMNMTIVIIFMTSITIVLLGLIIIVIIMKIMNIINIKILQPAFLATFFPLLDDFFPPDIYRH